MKLHLLILVVCGLLFFGSNTLFPDTTSSDKSQKKAFIISTDVDIDDWLAILYMHQHPQVDLKAVTVCGNGVAYGGPGVRNTQELLALGWPWNIPVTCGARKSLKYDHAFPAAWRIQYSNLLGLSLPENPFLPSTQPAEDLMIEIIQKNPGKINILAIGPLTDLALAMSKAPDIIKKIEMIYIMGGAVNVPGNVSIPCQTNIDNKCAEFNIYTDPVAAQQVLNSGANITLVPLDACNDVPLNIDFYHELIENHHTPQADFVYQALTKEIDFVSSGEYYFWDPLAAVIATDQSVITKSRMMNIDVVVDNGPESGCMKRVSGNDSINVCLGADKEKTWKQFIDILNCR